MLADVEKKDDAVAAVADAEDEDDDEEDETEGGMIKEGINIVIGMCEKIATNRDKNRSSIGNLCSPHESESKPS